MFTRKEKKYALLKDRDEIVLGQHPAKDYALQLQGFTDIPLTEKMPETGKKKKNSAKKRDTVLGKTVNPDVKGSAAPKPKTSISPPEWNDEDLKGTDMSGSYQEAGSERLHITYAKQEFNRWKARKLADFPELRLRSDDLWGEAKDNGDCFYESIAYGLHNLGKLNSYTWNRVQAIREVRAVIGRKAASSEQIYQLELKRDSTREPFLQWVADVAKCFEDYPRGKENPLFGSLMLEGKMLAEHYGVKISQFETIWTGSFSLAVTSVGSDSADEVKIILHENHVDPIQNLQEPSVARGKVETKKKEPSFARGKVETKKNIIQQQPRNSVSDIPLQNMVRDSRSDNMESDIKRDRKWIQMDEKNNPFITWETLAEQVAAFKQKALNKYRQVDRLLARSALNPDQDIQDYLTIVREQVNGCYQLCVRMYGKIDMVSEEETNERLVKYSRILTAIDQQAYATMDLYVKLIDHCPLRITVNRFKQVFSSLDNLRAELSKGWGSKIFRGCILGITVGTSGLCAAGIAGAAVLATIPVFGWALLLGSVLICGIAYGVYKYRSIKNAEEELPRLEAQLAAFQRTWDQFGAKVEEKDLDHLCEFFSAHLDQFLVYEQFVMSSLPTEDCIICMEKFLETERIVKTCDRHFFHKHCIDRSNQSRSSVNGGFRCPLCTRHYRNYTILKFGR